MKLGNLIAELKKHKPGEWLTIKGGPVPLTPGEVGSYRGYYDQLAIAVNGGGYATVGSLLAELEAAVGKTFTGYKGGEYVMTRDTKVWLANYGESGGSRVTGVREIKSDDGERTYGIELTWMADD